MWATSGASVNGSGRHLRGDGQPAPPAGADRHRLRLLRQRRRAQALDFSANPLTEPLSPEGLLNRPTGNPSAAPRPRPGLCRGRAAAGRTAVPSRQGRQRLPRRRGNHELRHEAVFKGETCANHGSFGAVRLLAGQGPHPCTDPVRRRWPTTRANGPSHRSGGPSDAFGPLIARRDCLGVRHRRLRRRRDDALRAGTLNGQTALHA